MHGRTQIWLAWMLAAALCCGMSGISQAQYVATDEASFGYQTANANQSVPATETAMESTEGTFVSAPAGDADLAKRIADLEKSIKKMDEKAAADKKAAAGKFSTAVGGRFYWDTAAFTQDAIDKARVNEKNGTEFRQLRLNASGAGFDVMKYKVEVDFAGEAVVAKDVYFAVTDLPIVQNVQVGHFKEPFSLDELTPDQYDMFMERSTGGGLIAPSRHMGVMAYGNNEAETATYAIGGFAEKAGAGIVQDDDLGGALTMRATYLPWYDEATEGRGLLHLGAAYSYRDPFQSKYSMSYRPESHLATAITPTAMTDVNERNMLGTELAFVYGPFSVQSEYMLNAINRSAHSDAQINSAYVEVSYFLTGENRPYNRKSGVFDRVKPYENFFRVRDEDGNVYMGKGAWELKYRYSYLDCYDGGAIAGGSTVGDNTFGVNWYLNPYTRVMAEYVHSGINRFGGAGEGDLNIVQVRAQIDF